MSENNSSLNQARPDDNANGITLSDILRVLRKNWILILIVTAFVFACGAFYTYVIAKPTYQATSTLSVEVPPTNKNVSVNEASGSVTASLHYVQSIAEFVKSETIMRSVSEKHLDITSYGKLRSETSVSYDPASIFIYITVTDADPKNARVLALAIAEELTRYSTDSTDEEVKKYLCTIVVRDRALYSFYASPNKKLYLIVSALGGLVLALAIVFIKEFASNKFQTPDEGRGIFSAVVIDIDDISGMAKQIFPIYYLEKEHEN